MKNLFTKTLLLGGLAGSLGIFGDVKGQDKSKDAPYIVENDRSIVEVKGEVINEELNGASGKKRRHYLIMDKNNKQYIGILQDPTIDPFNIGDSAKVKLEENIYFMRSSSTKIEYGYEIIQFCSYIHNRK